ncbi:MAG TPA: sigma-70 family RNA polymerase sigma factor [Pyrinomonadaceae bacterium]|nr:sigma-70 family RNA polymerase sigma factor [Pyrinomonadaceae bacterium]
MTPGSSSALASFMKLNPHPSAVSHEELFIERYSKLSAWAMQMTGSDRELAEDLVQDGFIQFTLTRPELQGIHHLDNYLYGLLRHLHLSQVRRSARSRLQPASIVEYESAEAGLQATDTRDQIKAQDELRQVCHYACVRKESSWAGIVLILRFFHGYYPSEIAKVLRTTRQSVDERLRIARGEARLSLSNPNALSFMKHSTAVPFGQTGFARKTDEFLIELRQTIFHSRRGRCLSRKQLQSLYTNELGLIKCEDLAHIVSCPSCLDTVNNLLGLPLLADRYPTDTMGRDKRGKGDKGDGGDQGGTGADQGVIKRLRRRARETFEHRPKELHISVNGLLHGSQKINSELSEQTVDVDMTEQISFVEVFSELGIRLLLLNVEDQPPRGPVEQAARVEFSDSRALELKLRFSSPWPTLHVAYADPVFREVQSPKSNVQSLEGVALPLEEIALPKASFENAQLEGQLVSGNQHGLWPNFPKYRPDFGLWTLDFGLLLKPATVTALIAATLIAAFFFTRLPGPVKPLSAAELLQQSAQQEEVFAARVDQVLHRTINLEERKASGELIAQRRVEVWQSAERGITARRLYDEKGYLVAGDWRRRDGVQTLYAHGSQPKLQNVPQKHDAANVNFENVWQLDPSAKDFSSLIASNERAQVEEKPNLYLITYEPPDPSQPAGGDNSTEPRMGRNVIAPGVSPGTTGANESEPRRGDRTTPTVASLVRASIVLSRADLHPIEQTLVVKQGDQTREYRFLEISFERRAPSTVAPKVFEPEPELLNAAKSETLNSKLETEALTASPRVVATADLEVEVLRLLNSAGADLGEQVSVTRTSEGELKIQGLVETDQRKTEILRALASVAKNPAVKIDVSTFGEALARQKQARGSKGAAGSGTTSAERIEAAGDVFPAYADLRGRFSDEEARRYATAMVNRSHEAMRRAWALKRLLQQFSAEDLRTLSPEARAKWLGLIRTHAGAFGRETAQLRQQLAPIFFPGGAGDDGAAGSPIASDADLLRAVERLIALSSANDQAVTAAFTVSANSTAGSAIKGAHFFRSLRSAEKLASEIGKYR